MKQIRLVVFRTFSVCYYQFWPGDVSFSWIYRECEFLQRFRSI